MFDFQKAKPGDYVKGYQKGIHRVVAIVPGCGCGKCFHLERVLDSNYRKGKGKSVCDGAYITLVDKQEVIKSLQDFSKEAINNVEKHLI